MPPETCEYHTLLVSDIAVIKNDIGYVKDRVCSHIEQGEEKGGFRDRLIITEHKVNEVTEEISALKKAEWKRVLISGLIGGLIGSLIGNVSPEVIMTVVKWLTTK